MNKKKVFILRTIIIICAFILGMVVRYLLKGE